jgi:hypothetical protein
MGARITGRNRQGGLYKRFRPLNVRSGGVGYSIKDPACERGCQETERLDRSGIDRQRPLVPTNRLRVAVGCYRLRVHATAAKNVVEHIAMLGTAPSLRDDKLQLQGVRNPSCYSFCNVNKSPMSLSNRSAHRCASVSVSIN